jgi:hypothetical protein
MKKFLLAILAALTLGGVVPTLASADIGRS